LKHVYDQSGCDCHEYRRTDRLEQIRSLRFCLCIAEIQGNRVSEYADEHGIAEIEQDSFGECGLPEDRQDKKTNAVFIIPAPSTTAPACRLSIFVIRTKNIAAAVQTRLTVIPAIGRKIVRRSNSAPEKTSAGKVT
jgi:hypothetical protein